MNWTFDFVVHATDLQITTSQQMEVHVRQNHQQFWHRQHVLVRQTSVCHFLLFFASYKIIKAIMRRISTLLDANKYTFLMKFLLQLICMTTQAFSENKSAIFCVFKDNRKNIRVFDTKTLLVYLNKNWNHRDKRQHSTKHHACWPLLNWLKTSLKYDDNKRSAINIQ